MIHTFTMFDKPILRGVLWFAKAKKDTPPIINTSEERDTTPPIPDPRESPGKESLKVSTPQARTPVTPKKFAAVSSTLNSVDHAYMYGVPSTGCIWGSLPGC